MKSRGLVVGLALILALAAAAGVMLYTNGVKNNAVGAGAAADVIVSSKDISTNTSLTTLVDQGAFKVVRIPSDAVVEGAVTDVNQLRNQTTTQPIFKNEQIPASRLSSGTAAKGGALGISEGHVAVSVKMDGPAGVNGAVTRGSYVVIYASFDNVAFLQGQTAQARINSATKTAAGGVRATLPPLTLTLIPAAKVLDVVNPPIDASGKTTGGAVTLTLDLSPQDAQMLVYARHVGDVSIGLLPPGDNNGHPLPFSSIPLSRLLGKNGS
jgi:Flp pilus assembly protein CpaB